jgi:hypothetical protein
MGNPARFILETEMKQIWIVKGAVSDPLFWTEAVGAHVSEGCMMSNGSSQMARRASADPLLIFCLWKMGCGITRPRFFILWSDGHANRNNRNFPV